MTAREKRALAIAALAFLFLRSKSSGAAKVAPDALGPAEGATNATNDPRGRFAGASAQSVPLTDEQRARGVRDQSGTRGAPGTEATATQEQLDEAQGGNP